MNYKHFIWMLGLRAGLDLTFGPDLRPQTLFVGAAGAIISVVLFAVVVRAREEFLRATMPSLRSYVSVAYAATLLSVPLLPLEVMIGGWLGYWLSWASSVPLALLLYLSGAQLPVPRRSGEKILRADG